MYHERVCHSYYFRNQLISELVEIISSVIMFPSSEEKVSKQREFRPLLDVGELTEILDTLSSYEKTHLKRAAYPIYRSLIELGEDPDDYVENAEIMDVVVNSNYRTPQELHIGDPRAWELVQQRGLEKKIFPSLKPAYRLLELGI